MHSRIIQLSIKPIQEVDYIEDWNIDEWFFDEVADYIQESDREEDIEWVRDIFSAYKNIAINEDDMFEIKDVKELHEEWFRERYNTYQKLAASMTFEEFAKGREAYRMSKLMEDMRDLYIYHSDMEALMSIDHFLREFAVTNTKGYKFYIGGTFDYHY